MLLCEPIGKVRIRSGRHLHNIMLTGVLVQRTSMLKDLPSKHAGEHRLKSLDIVCIGHSYGNKVCVNNTDKIINIFAQPQ